jgi:6-phosphogluconate dehydrogenase
MNEIGIIGVDVMGGNQAYYDLARRACLLSSLIQTQRDLFGAHTYIRIDRPGVFH